MKKLSLLVLILMLVLGWSRWGAGEIAVPPYRDAELLQTALAATTAEPRKGELHVRAPIGNGPLSIPDAEAVLAAIAKDLDVGRYEYDIASRSNGHCCTAEMKSKFAETALLCLGVCSDPEITTVEVSISFQNPGYMAKYLAAVKTALSNTGALEGETEATLYFEGSLDTPLRQSEELDVVYKAFKATGTVYRGAVCANGECQWSGWSPLFARSVEVGGDQVNFVISLFKDCDATVVRVATPLLP